MKALAIFAGPEHTPGACEIYRITMPYHYLGLKSRWDAQWTYFQTLWEHSDLKNSASAWVNLFKTYDLLVLPRYYTTLPENFEELTRLIYLAHSLGCKVVYEVDDDYTNEERKVIDGDALAVARLCDALTVTTRYLGEMMAERTEKPYHILPNTIDPEVWQAKRVGEFKLQDKIIIGLSGSPTHLEDWRVLGEVLPTLMDRYQDKVHLLVTGFHPDYLAGLPSTEYLPAVDYMTYAQIIQRCDIILAPVNNDRFNLGKSPIKVIEGMGARRMLRNQAVGAACIASDHPIYRLAIVDEKTGLLTSHTPQGWATALERLIEDPKLRWSLQASGYTWVWRNHNIQTEWRRWDQAYSRIKRGV